MAYTVDDWRFTCEGMVGPSERWSNTWTFNDTAGTGDPEDVAAHLRTFYNDLHSFWSTAWTLTTIRYRNLVTNVDTISSAAAITGSAGTDMLPSQLAVRVSLNTASGVNGGPFLGGWTVASVDASNDGSFIDTQQADVATALTNLNNNVTSDDWAIALDRPTVPEVSACNRGRVGKRFDVIRKRSNDTPEVYETVDLG